MPVWRPFEGLPAYFGGKRRLAARIFREISKVHPSEDWSHLRLVDAFLGGGSISLYAKAQGFSVICGDVAERSYTIGKALIENGSVQIQESDLGYLFAAADGNRHLVRDHYVPDCFTSK